MIYKWYIYDIYRPFRFHGYHFVFETLNQSIILIGIFSKKHDPQNVKNDVFKRAKAWPITNGSTLTLLWSQWSLVKKLGQTSQSNGGNLHLKPVMSQFQWEEVGRVLKNGSCIIKKQPLFWFKEGLMITLQNV